MKKDFTNLWDRIRKVQFAKYADLEFVILSVSEFFKDKFVIPKPNTQEAIDTFASMSLPEPYQIREVREALIKSIKDFSALYEDEGESFDEIKMEVAVMQMLTEHFTSLAKEQQH